MMKQFTENKKLNKIKIHASIACLSPYLQSRFFLKNCNEAKLDPLNEQRVRIWLREIYPQFFNKQDLFHENHECDSLQLEEIRAVFRALIEEHIKEEWFLDTMFTPELGESLALLLRNQRDRMLLNYHQNLKGGQVSPGGNGRTDGQDRDTRQERRRNRDHVCNCAV
jgi:hypothetical protein